MRGNQEIGLAIAAFRHRRLDGHEPVIPPVGERRGKGGVYGGRQRLFSELLIETDKAILRSIGEKFSHPSDLNEVSKRFSEVELLATHSVIATAKVLYDEVLQAHMRGEGQKSNYNERKQAFIAAARSELAALES